VTWEVIARYLLNDPTIWAYDLTYMLYGSMFMLGTAYALLRGAHIRTDMLWDRWSDRRKGMVDAIAFLAFFFPAMVMVLLSSVDDAWYAFRIGERSEQTAWRPLIWPFKATVPLAAFLLIVQGVSELLKNIYAIRTGRLWAKREEIQI
jgi:TRAP-type mannitol/chloroaromatic compound transport system permease small subunit